MDSDPENIMLIDGIISNSDEDNPRNTNIGIIDTNVDVPMTLNEMLLQESESNQAPIDISDIKSFSEKIVETLRLLRSNSFVPPVDMMYESTVHLDPLMSFHQQTRNTQFDVSN
jgi:hypothetical protein